MASGVTVRAGSCVGSSIWSGLGGGGDDSVLILLAGERGLGVDPRLSGKMGPEVDLVKMVANGPEMGEGAMGVSWFVA